jgi:putative endonuclease
LKNTKKIGDEGEGIALQYFRKKGYKIIAKNYRFKRSEIDLIMKSPDGITVFVEVKYRKSNKYGFPEEMVTEAQQERILAAADHFILETKLSSTAPVRFDILSITNGEPSEINHFTDAF